jgi:ribosomal protein L16 Arg81 hydroxylase
MSALLEIEADQFAANFGREAFGMRHNLSAHPLLSVESVAVLADRLPEEHVEHNRGDIPTVVASGQADAVEAAPGEIARNIDSNKCWMVLKRIEQVEEYHRLLDETLDELPAGVIQREGGTILREGYIFLSAPSSTTPAHTDHEHNFLLQIRGSKEMNVGRFADRKLEQLHLEKIFAGGHRNMDRMPEDPISYRLGPGDGVYVPPVAPHWVVNGPEVSVSLSITFRTPISRRAEVVHGVNQRLRKLRLSPRPPGESETSDRAKELLHRSARTILRR